ncbi:hypothetical protein DUNSADRAFT_17359 [Dunaliella salina]|uniref:Anaphase-promoting complex subunit 5 n=1 Tax=Dunaliella salina TaxID=3046 RepID=A0ABQ7H098_DUNSA|nr:hypothetical protein DUNSADRAFT_17359 [Dunaliella salina]|eukprot:KAF5840256.1 hypothetical protein DUNSADRAFT_17359 [Dunaliella salina]
MDPNVVMALGVLASKFESEGRPMEALHCLHALLLSRLLPDQEAKARVQTGRLMLEHTTNHKEAYKELMAAQQVASSLVGCHSLKCEIFCWLARYHQLQGQTNLQVQALNQGLQLCATASSSTERPLLLRWGAFFHAKLASALWDSGEVLSRIRHATDLGANYAKQHGMLDSELLFELLHLQLDLVEAQSQGSSTSSAGPTAAPHAPPPSSTPNTAAAAAAPHDPDTAIKLRFMALDALMDRLHQEQQQGGLHPSSEDPAQARCAVPPSPLGLPLPTGFLSYAVMHTSLMQALYELGRGRTDKMIAVHVAILARGRCRHQPVRRTAGRVLQQARAGVRAAKDWPSCSSGSARRAASGRAGNQ